MSCWKPGPGANKFPNLSDVPIVNPCEGVGYKAPFRPEVPFKLMLVAQWYDELAEIEKRFLLSYYHFDGTIELKDIDRQRPFLQRRKMENIRLSDLYIGNKVYVLGRHMVILDYGDGITRDYLNPFHERAFLLVRPEALEYLPNIITRLEKCFRILFAKMACLSKDVAITILETNEGLLLKNLEGQPVVAFFLMAQNAMAKLKNLVGEDPDPQQCLLKNHLSLRAVYGKDAIRNGFYYPVCEELMTRDASWFFSGCPQCTLRSTVRMNGHTTCCIIKPHILREGRAGVVLNDIVASGYVVTALGVFWLNKRQAAEFYEVYERIYVASEYMDMVDELAIGPCMAVELAFRNPVCDPCAPPDPCKLSDIVPCFRQCVGPPDPDLARKVRPCTLRARHGLTKTQNAVHCTDLPEDAKLEVEYFFKILDRRAHGIKFATGDMSSSCNYN